ncbi:aldo/keto reductase [Streptomyces sp. NPDC006476]|uniref:aldo/keto reductase n=1 Tax=Streptomyces sp. NPDC006476 TaxID=3157175 RepID=UPI0033AE9772
MNDSAPSDFAAQGLYLSRLKANNFGRSGVEITSLAFGGTRIGNVYGQVTDLEAYAAIENAWWQGIRYFDTAPHYGYGLSERRLGAALRGHRRAAYTVSTKVGGQVEPVGSRDDPFAPPVGPRHSWDFSAEAIRRSLESSLTRLGLTWVDVVYLDVPDEHAERALNEGYPALEQMREEGLVTAIGACMNQPETLIRFIGDTDIDVVLCTDVHPLLDERPLYNVVAAAQEQGVSVVIGGTFSHDLLAEPTTQKTTAHAPPAQLRRLSALRAIAERHGTTLSAAALATCSAHPSVAGILIDGRSYDHVNDCVRECSAAIPVDFWRELQQKGFTPIDACARRRLAVRRAASLISACRTSGQVK